MNGLKATAVALILFGLAFGSGYQLLFRLAYAVLAVVLISIVWTWLSVAGLRLRRVAGTQRAQVGQTLHESLTLSNYFLPKVWLEVRDHSTLLGHGASRAFALGPNGSKTWTVRTQCRRRGLFHLGPATVAGGDPFGLFRRRKRLAGGSSIIVYPATVDLLGFKIPLGQLPGGSVLRERAHHITPNSLGIRPYVQGDSLKRIHWPSTARLGTLTVKEFELDPISDMWVVLDGDRATQCGWGDDSTEEYGVTAAASLARHFLQQHRAVGLIVYGGQACVLPADRGDRQLIKVLEELAVLRAAGRTSLAEVITAETARFGRSTTLIVVTASVDEGWLTALKQEMLRGVRAVAVLLDPTGFGGPDSGRQIAGKVAAAQVPLFLVNRGDDLAKALAAPANGWVQ